MDIAIGLSQYATAFHDSDIDFRVLPGLTGDDLREIGVLSVGHRRLLMQAIGRLGEAPANAGALTRSRVSAKGH